MTRGITKIDEYVARRIRARRLMQRVSQEQLAEKLGLTFQQIQKYEKASNRVSAGRLAKIAEVLGTEPAWFFAGAPGITDTANGEPDISSHFFATAGADRIAWAFVRMTNNADRQLLAEIADRLADAGVASTLTQAERDTVSARAVGRA